MVGEDKNNRKRNEHGSCLAVAILTLSVNYNSLMASLNSLEALFLDVILDALNIILK